MLEGFQIMEEGLEFYFESKKCLKEGGFELRNGILIRKN